jgi:hypothetical protein
MPVTVPFNAPEGKNTEVALARLRTGNNTEPATVTFTLGAELAKDATSATVTTVTTTLAAGQWLAFKDDNDQYYHPVRVSADYDDGTTLTLDVVPETIPNGATAVFPVKSFLRTSADLSSSSSTTTFSTFDHSSGATVTIDETTNSMTFSGFYAEQDAVAKTLRGALADKARVYVTRTLEAPSGFTTGTKQGAAGVVSAIDSGAPNEDRVSFDYTIELDGSLNETFATGGT